MKSKHANLAVVGGAILLLLLLFVFTRVLGKEGFFVDVKQKVSTMSLPTMLPPLNPPLGGIYSFGCSSSSKCATGLMCSNSMCVPDTSKTSLGYYIGTDGKSQCPYNNTMSAFNGINKGTDCTQFNDTTNPCYQQGAYKACLTKNNCPAP